MLLNVDQDTTAPTGLCFWCNTIDHISSSPHLYARAQNQSSTGFSFLPMPVSHMPVMCRSTISKKHAQAQSLQTHKYTTASRATIWFSSCAVAYRSTHAGNVAHLLWIRRSSSHSYEVIVSDTQLLQPNTICLLLIPMWRSNSSMDRFDWNCCLHVAVLQV